MSTLDSAAASAAGTPVLVGPPDAEDALVPVGPPDAEDALVPVGPPDAEDALVPVGPPDAEDALVPVGSGDLLQWAHLPGWINDALGQAAETTRFDLARHLPDPVTLPQLTAALDAAAERIGALLDGEGWWQQS